MEPVIANSALATIDPTESVSHALEDFHPCGKARYGTVFVLHQLEDVGKSCCQSIGYVMPTIVISLGPAT